MTALSGARDVASMTSRLATVTRILGKHGFSRLLRGGTHWPPPADVRAALESLGVVFLKLGQVLSTRRDILPSEYIAELEQLQDHIPPEDSRAVREVVQAELGSAPEELFSLFESTPLAAATIAQVHGARMPDGRDVVVKIQRSGLEETITQDLAILAYLASILDVVAPALRPFDLPAMVREFHQSLLHELDFQREARNVRRFRQALADVPHVWIPDVIQERTTTRVITFERSHGAHVNRFVADRPEQRSQVAHRLAQVFLRQVFEEGLFHADPHPGNFFVLEDGTLCLHDFGIIGEIDPPMRDALADLLTSFVRDDAKGAAVAYFDLGLAGPDVDRRVVEDEIRALLRKIRDRPLAEVSVGLALESLLRLGSQHRIRNPGSLLMLSRAFLTLEAVMRDLDPDLSVIDAFREAAPGIARKRFAPERLLSDAGEMGRQLERFVRESPAELRRALRRLADGDLGEVQIRDHPTLTELHGRQLGLLLRTVAAGFLAMAGAVLLQEQGWRLVTGAVLLSLGVGGLAATALRSKIKR